MTNTGQSEPGQSLPQPHGALKAPDSLKLHPLMTALMIILAQMICKTLEQVPSSSTEHVVGSSKVGTCHTCQERLQCLCCDFRKVRH